MELLLVKWRCVHSKEVHKNEICDSWFIQFVLGDRHQKSVLNFTFRDSIKDFVNIAYWLPPKDLIIISSKFTTGDVGKTYSIVQYILNIPFQWLFIIL